MPEIAPEAPISGAPRLRGHRDMGKTADNAARDIKDDEAEMTHRPLHIVAQHIEEQHVGGEMHPVAVQKRVGDERQLRRDHQRDAFGIDARRHEGRHHAEVEGDRLHELRRQRREREKDADIHREQNPDDPRADARRRVNIVIDRNDHGGFAI